MNIAFQIEGILISIRLKITLIYYTIDKVLRYCVYIFDIEAFYRKKAMKKLNIYHAIAAPVIALFAVGCSGTTALQSTEYDDMYYSSSDRTEYVQPQAQAPQQQQYAAAEDNQQATEGTQEYYADEYYDGRSYRPQATWTAPNYAYVDPYWTSAYVHRANRFNSFYDPFLHNSFYDPFMGAGFYDPFLRGSGLRVSIGLGMGWGNGWNRWGHPYGMYNPYMGGGWWPYNNYYAGFYNGYNRGFYGNNRFLSDRPVVVQPRQYGPRESRGGVPVTGSPERVAGRPVRAQQATAGEQQAGQNVDYARPGRADRTTGTNEIRSEQARPAQGAREARPARPSRQQPAQRVAPAQQGNPAMQQRQIQRQERTAPTQRQERVQPVQRAQPSYQRTQPSYQRSQPVQRAAPSYQRSQPVQRSQPSYSPPTRSSGTSSPPVRSSGGGRPGRGGN